MKLTNKFRAPVQEAQPEFVVIKSTPDKAKVSINGEAKGTTPINNLALFPGTYKYKIEKENYYPEEGDLIVEESKKSTINSILKPKFGTLIIDSKPIQGVVVLIDDKETGQQTPYKNEQYASGTYTLTLKKANYYDVVKQFTVSDGLSTTISEEMKPKFGTITITSVPETNADIILDNVTLNQKTPYTLPVISSGNHTVEVQKEMYEPATQSFTVQDGQTANITLTMKPLFGEINISTNPTSDIYIDKEKAGSVSINNKRLVSGTHLLEAKKEKHTDAIKTIDVKVNTKETYLLEPKPKTGTISVVTDPGDAEVWLDDTKKDNSPTFLRNLIIGNYTIELKLTGYGTVKKTVTVEENKTAEINETLPQGEHVTINTTPAGAKIKIDGGVEQGTPYTGTLSYGTHNIIAVPDAKGYLETTENISITQGGKTSFTFVLKPDSKDYTETTSSLNIDMVYIKGGTFTMGCTSEQSDCEEDEKPAHSVTLSDYYIGKFEVTQKQWTAIMGNNPSYFKDCGNCPVETVSYNEIQDFLQKLNQKTGKKYSLPTEAQWEYAARGGVMSQGLASHTKYAGSNAIGDVAWFTVNSDSKTHPVGQKNANELGIFDMSGNVWEWCSDWYDKDYYKHSPQNNPENTNNGSDRVLRGGSWYGLESGCRVANRRNRNPDGRSRIYGFRLVLVPD